MTRKQIAAKIKKEREAQNLSVYKLAKNAGIRIDILQRIETGKHEFEFTTLEKIATALGLQIELTKKQVKIILAKKLKQYLKSNKKK